MKDDKIVIPVALKESTVQWYHNQPCHPGQTRTKLTVCQHFIWDGLSTAVKKICSACCTCQLTKRKKVKYDHLPTKETQTTPWDMLCEYLIGPYKFKQFNNQTQQLWALTMIDTVTDGLT